jgi:hypothetical protein
MASMDEVFGYDTENLRVLLISAFLERPLAVLRVAARAFGICFFDRPDFLLGI